MGLITNKKTQEIIYNGPLTDADHFPNWNDSMATYYPYIFALTTEGAKTFRVSSENSSDFEFIFDEPERAIFLKKLDEARKEQEAIRRKTQFDIGALVKAVRGRKVKPGTIGVVKWVGYGKFGLSLGILEEGKTSYTFISARNAERID
jgi:hypothetical protein